MIDQPEGTLPLRPVRLSEILFRQLGVTVVEWGEADEEGFFVPTIRTDMNISLWHVMDSINAALDKDRQHDSVESDLLEAHAALESVLIPHHEHQWVSWADIWGQPLGEKVFSNGRGCRICYIREPA